MAQPKYSQYTKLIFFFYKRNDSKVMELVTASSYLKIIKFALREAGMGYV